MGCLAPDTPAPREAGGEFTSFVNAYMQAMPQIYQAESTYRPLYAGLDLSQLYATLYGQPGGEVTAYQMQPTGEYEWYTTPTGAQFKIPKMERVPYTVQQEAQPGLLDIYEETAPRMYDINRAGRAAEIADVAALGPQATEAFKAANPAQAALLDELNRQAQEELAAGTSMDPSLRREVTQAVRGAQAARGAGYGPTDIFTEAYTLGQKGEDLRRARQQFAGQMVGVNAATTIDPFMAILGRPSQSNMMAAQFLGQGQAFNQGQGPTMFNPMNSYMQDLFNTNYNAEAAANIAGANNWSALIGSLIGGAGMGAGLAAMCWVAREVYGEANPRWMQFRHWLLTRAPGWLVRLYARHGEAFAQWLKDKPRMKTLIRLWMDRRIATLA